MLRFERLLMVFALAVAGSCRETPDTPEARLENAASKTARFIAGYGRFDELHLADSVDLHIAADGGGGHARLAREQLRDPKAWQVASGGVMRSFVPRGLKTRLVASVGHYMNCTPSELGTRFPRLASLPHVGVKLEPANAKSCLESWNTTFVFDTTGGRTDLVAAIYDQWEW